MRNVYYDNPEMLDLQKIRADAQRRAKGDAFNDPADTNIHFHSYTQSCAGRQHEQYEAVKEPVETAPPEEDES